MDDVKKATDGFSRREFAAMTTVVAAGAGCAKAAPATASVDLQVKTPDGLCDAVLIHPAGEGAWPAVLVWPDAFGLRPSFRAMGARLAGEGYTVLVVNQFYRSRRPPIFPDPVNFSDPAVRAQLGELRKLLTQEAVMRDGAAMIRFLDGQKAVNAKAKAGVIGFCMGGAMTIQTAAAVPDRIGAGCSFHGGSLVTENPDSPHLLIPKLKAAYYFGISGDDDAKDPKAKEVLRQAFAAAKLPAKIEVYATSKHGWTVTDSLVYDKPEAERAWSEQTALFKSALV